MHIRRTFFVLCLLFRYVVCEVFTAVENLKEVLQIERVLVDSLQNYIEIETQKINILQKYVEIHKKEYEVASKDMDAYVGNPLNAYTLIKRLTVDWVHVEILMSANISEEFLPNISLYKQNLMFPTEGDLNGAATALNRLQDTYKLDIISIAKGALNVEYSSNLSASDCFEVGRRSFVEDDFHHTLLWMQAADDKLKEEPDMLIDRIEVLDYLVTSAYQQGNTSLALKYTKEILQLSPIHPKALENKAVFEEEIRNGFPQADSVIPEDYDRTFQEQLCRGEIVTPVEITSQLKCRYVSNKNLFLLIAPFKLEEIYRSPNIVIFHDIMSDSEMDTIKNLSQPRLERAVVINSRGDTEIAHYRISKSAWLNNNDSKHINAVSKRVADMAGLSMETAEELQVLNYGIGGYYMSHYDFAREGEVDYFLERGQGNRIATVLFYLSDVKEGGATAFSEIGTVVWPKKGTAVLWYNLHPSGEPDYDTAHTACPVLVGSKWGVFTVANKWIHETGQEFLRLCNLIRDPRELEE